MYKRSESDISVCYTINREDKRRSCRWYTASTPAFYICPVDGVAHRNIGFRPFVDRFRLTFWSINSFESTVLLRIVSAKIAEAMHVLWHRLQDIAKSCLRWKILTLWSKWLQNAQNMLEIEDYAFPFELHNGALKKITPTATKKKAVGVIFFNAP